MSSRINPLRIVVAMPFYYPATRFGGPVTQAKLVCDRLADRGHRVRVVTTDLGLSDDVPRDAWSDLDGVQVWYGRTKALHRVAPYYAPMLRAPLAEACVDADVLQLRVGLTLLSSMARRVASRAAVPYVYNAEGALCPRRLLVRKWSKRLFVRLHERAVLRDAAALQAVTEKERADYLRLGAASERIETIPNGVELPNLAKDVGVRAFRGSIGLSGDARIVLFLGRLQKIKGVDLLLEAMLKLLQRFPDAHLIYAGPDEDCRASLERRVVAAGASDRVRFVGALQGSRKDAALRAADVFALTSYSEGLPNAALEALAAGTPALLTEPCNLPDVARYDAGAVVPPEVDAISAALAEMLADEDLRRRRGENARRLAEERFAIDAIVDRLETLYDRLRRERAERKSSTRDS